ncbi:hypothetical protein JCM17380_14550 [Desulfosporosinus burensis]
MLTALLIIFVLGLAIGVPVAVALILGAMGGLAISGVPLMIVPQKMFSAVDAYSLLAIPFFILAGALMQTGGMGQRLVRLASALVGTLPGGLAMVSVVASMFFGALTGSAPATTAAVGGITIPEMNKKGYDPCFSASLLASAGILGVLIPPSIPLVLYGVATNTSIAKLFAAGIMPGIILGLVLMGYSYYTSVKNGYKGEGRVSAKELWSAFKESLLALLMPVIILGGIYGGFFTPTEAAVIASVYAFIIGGLVYREIKLKDLPAIGYSVAESTATIMLVVAAATLFGWLMTNEGIPVILTKGILNISSNPFLILLLLNIVFLVTGMFMNQGPAILILAPIVLPIITKLGVDPIFYGAIMTMVLSLGQVTPPVALSLFVASKIADIPIEKLVPKLMPMLIVMVITALILTYLPGVVMFVPNLFGM